MQFIDKLYDLPSDVQESHLKLVSGSGFYASVGVLFVIDEDTTDTLNAVPVRYMCILVCQWRG